MDKKEIDNAISAFGEVLGDSELDGEQQASLIWCLVKAINVWLQEQQECNDEQR